VRKLVGPQLFNITKFLASLGAIGIGITDYLLTLCNNNGVSRNIPYNNARITHFNPWDIVQIFKKIIRLYLVGP